MKKKKTEELVNKKLRSPSPTELRGGQKSC
jgi:hypothetical protein